MYLDGTQPVKLICGNAHPQLGRHLGAALDLPLIEAEVTAFADGETRVHVEADVRDATVCILQPTCPPVNDNLLSLVLIVDAVRAAGAAKIIAITPYFGYARQERRGRIGDPRSAQVAAKLLGSVGLDHLIVLDLHAPALESAFSFSVTSLDPAELFLSVIQGWNLKQTTVVSPDAGGMKRAQRLAMLLDAPVAVVSKVRPHPDAAAPFYLSGDVRNRACVVVDDMASTGKTLLIAAECLSRFGAASVHAVFTHAVMAPRALERILTSAYKHVLTSDSVPTTEHPGIDLVSIVPLLAATLRYQCHIAS